MNDFPEAETASRPEWRSEFGGATRDKSTSGPFANSYPRPKPVGMTRIVGPLDVVREPLDETSIADLHRSCIETKAAYRRVMEQ